MREVHLNTGVAACDEFGRALQSLSKVLQSDTELGTSHSFRAARLQQLKKQLLNVAHETVRLRDKLVEIRGQCDFSHQRQDQPAEAETEEVHVAIGGPETALVGACIQTHAGKKIDTDADADADTLREGSKLRAQAQVGYETLFATDSFALGILPDTAEVCHLLEKLDAVNGTIRALDEMMAAASFDYGSTTQEHKCFNESICTPGHTDADAGQLVEMPKIQARSEINLMPDSLQVCPTPMTEPGNLSTPATVPGEFHMQQATLNTRLGDAEDTAHIASLLCSPDVHAQQFAAQILRADAHGAEKRRMSEDPLPEPATNGVNDDTNPAARMHMAAADGCNHVALCAPNISSQVAVNAFSANNIPQHEKSFGEEHAVVIWEPLAEFEQKETAFHVHGPTLGMEATLDAPMAWQAYKVEQQELALCMYEPQAENRSIKVTPASSEGFCAAQKPIQQSSVNGGPHGGLKQMQALADPQSSTKADPCMSKGPPVQGDDGCGGASAVGAVHGSVACTGVAAVAECVGGARGAGAGVGAGRSISRTRRRASGQRNQLSEQRMVPDSDAIEPFSQDPDGVNNRKAEDVSCGACPNRPSRTIEDADPVICSAPEIRKSGASNAARIQKAVSHDGGNIGCPMQDVHMCSGHADIQTKKDGDAQLQVVMTTCSKEENQENRPAFANIMNEVEKQEDSVRPVAPGSEPLLELVEPLLEPRRVTPRRRPGLRSMTNAAVTTAIVPQTDVESAAIVSPKGLKVLFTGFARSDLYRFRRCVSRLDGVVVRELPLGENDWRSSDSVRVVARCGSLAMGGSSRPAASGIPESAMSCAAICRTIKYFDALLSGAWVLSPEWVLCSYTAGRWLPEADFELAGDPAGKGGPSRGRSHGPDLFSGLRLFFGPAEAAASKHSESPPVNTITGKSCALLDEDGGPDPSELERFARRGGAEVLNAIRPLPPLQQDPPHLSDGARAVVVSTSSTGRPSKARRTESGAKDVLSEGTPWWRRPIAIVSGGRACNSNTVPQAAGRGAARGRAASSAVNAAIGAGWSVLPSNWMLDCISNGEILAPPFDWLAMGTSPTVPTTRVVGKRSIGQS